MVSFRGAKHVSSGKLVDLLHDSKRQRSPVISCFKHLVKTLQCYNLVTVFYWNWWLLYQSFLFIRAWINSVLKYTKPFTLLKLTRFSTRFVYFWFPHVYLRQGRIWVPPHCSFRLKNIFTICHTFNKRHQVLIASLTYAL